MFCSGSDGSPVGSGGAGQWPPRLLGDTGECQHLPASLTALWWGPRPAFQEHPGDSHRKPIIHSAEVHWPPRMWGYSSEPCEPGRGIWGSPWTPQQVTPASWGKGRVSSEPPAQCWDSPLQTLPEHLAESQAGAMAPRGHCVPCLGPSISPSTVKPLSTAQGTNTGHWATRRAWLGHASNVRVPRMSLGGASAAVCPGHCQASAWLARPGGTGPFAAEPTSPPLKTENPGLEPGPESQERMKMRE